MNKRAGPEADHIRENFGRIWPVHLSAFTRLLVRLRGHFDGDLDLLLVLSVIADRTRPDDWSPEVQTYRQLTRGNGNEHLQVPINIQSVAEFSGVPRETVRRKVKHLMERGWIERDARGLLRVSRQAAGDLEQATGESIAYLAALLAAFRDTSGTSATAPRRQP